MDLKTHGKCRHLHPTPDRKHRQAAHWMSRLSVGALAICNFDTALGTHSAQASPPKLSTNKPDTVVAPESKLAPLSTPRGQMSVWVDELPGIRQLAEFSPTRLAPAGGMTQPPDSQSLEAGQGAAAKLRTQPQTLSQQPMEPIPNPTANVRRQGSQVLGTPFVQLQGVYVQQGDDSSARARLSGSYAISPQVLLGAVVDLTTGNAFSDTVGTGLSLNELYVSAAPIPSLPGLRLVAGLMDLTSYFDRNSFAKDGASHFFNAAFQTNPALSAAGLSSRPGLLLNWSLNDSVDVKAAAFSSNRNLGDFSLDGFAGEVGVRVGTAILRGTYLSSQDAGQRSGFQEIGQVLRFGDRGIRSSDREEAYGINAEVFIPSLKLGLFGRYGRYDNLNLDLSGETYSLGLSLLDLFQRDDRLGLAYGRQLSNEELRQASGANTPDVLELYYDFRLGQSLRAAVTLQERNGFSETVVGVRFKTEFNIAPGGRSF